MTRGEIFDDWIREMVRGPVVKSYPRHSLVFDDSDMHSIASWTKYSPLHLLQRRFSVVVIFVNWGHKNLLGSQSSLLKAGEENERRFSVVVIFVNWGHKNLLGSQSSLRKAGEENEVTCVLWFLNPDSYGETPDKQKAVTTRKQRNSDGK
ncbi:hypothetical protein YC2023_052810 [Brassica napus]